MRNIIKPFVALFLFATLLSCGGDVKIPSKISLKVGPGYTAGIGTYVTVALNQSVTVGILASKLEPSTVLKTLQISNVFDATTTTNIVSTETLSDKDSGTLNRDYTFKTRSVAGIEKWIFAVTNSDGVTNQVYITLVVQ